MITSNAPLFHISRASVKGQENSISIKWKLSTIKALIKFRHPDNSPRGPRQLIFYLLSPFPFFSFEMPNAETLKSVIKIDPRHFRHKNQILQNR